MRINRSALFVVFLGTAAIAKPDIAQPVKLVLPAAKKQAEAMAKTKRSLRDVVAKAEKANSGYKAVSVVAEIENSTAQADVGLLKGTDWKQVEDKL
jgi:hypothetical protein